VVRPEKITLEAKNLDGKKVKYKFDDVLARIVQHELDHLNGILFIQKAESTYKNSKHK
jgi:peptide deformylase